jgi:DNA-binding XRE family transcriptional regulator
MARTPPARSEAAIAVLKGVQLAQCPRCHGTGKIPQMEVGLGDRIRTLRLTAQKTQADLATALGVSRVQINNIEQGRNRGSLTLLTRVCDLFDVSLDYLLGRSDARVAATTVTWRKNGGSQ